MFLCFFFFQAEDGIRDRDVTGVQTCALPIYLPVIVVMKGAQSFHISDLYEHTVKDNERVLVNEIGRASCRERV